MMDDIIYKNKFEGAEKVRLNPNFTLYDDKGAQFKEDLLAAGFTGLKMWEQPINMNFKNGGAEFFDIYVKSKITSESKYTVFKFSEEQLQKI